MKPRYLAMVSVALASTAIGLWHGLAPGLTAGAVGSFVLAVWLGLFDN